MQPAIFARGDRVVALMICDGKIVLIHRQTPDREYYVLPGGAIETDETPLVACLREVVEETGLIGSAATYLCTLDNRGRQEHYFLVETEHGTLVLGEPERNRHTDHNRYRPMWLNRAQLETLPILPGDAHRLILTHLKPLP